MKANELRYADVPGIDVDVLVDASPSDLWALIADINTPARFSTEYVGGEWLDEPGLGARFRGRNRRQGAEWSTTSTVAWFEREREFGWIVGDASDPTATWRFTIEPGEQGCRLRYEATMGPGPSGVLDAIRRRPDRESRIIELRLEEWRSNMQATVDGIRDLAEAR